MAIIRVGSGFVYSRLYLGVCPLRTTGLVSGKPSSQKIRSQGFGFDLLSCFRFIEKSAKIQIGRVLFRKSEVKWQFERPRGIWQNNNK
jgi:hypothetical protein